MLPPTKLDLDNWVFVSYSNGHGEVSNCGRLLYRTPAPAARPQAIDEAWAWVEHAKRTWSLVAYGQSPYPTGLWLAPEGEWYCISQLPREHRPHIVRISNESAWRVYAEAQYKLAPFPDWALPKP